MHFRSLTMGTFHPDAVIDTLTLGLFEAAVLDRLRVPTARADACYRIWSGRPFGAARGPLLAANPNSRPCLKADLRRDRPVRDSRSTNSPGRPAGQQVARWPYAKLTLVSAGSSAPPPSTMPAASMHPSRPESAAVARDGATGSARPPRDWPISKSHPRAAKRLARRPRPIGRSASSSHRCPSSS